MSVKHPCDVTKRPEPVFYLQEFSAYAGEATPGIQDSPRFMVKPNLPEERHGCFTARRRHEGKYRAHRGVLAGSLFLLHSPVLSGSQEELKAPCSP